MANRKKPLLISRSRRSLATSRTHHAVASSLDRDPIEAGHGVRILPPSNESDSIELGNESVLHITARFLSEGRAQISEFAADASSAIRDTLADARSRRFEAVQQAKARRIMLESYQGALKRHAAAQKILGPHVRFVGQTAKSAWIVLFLVGDAAGMTLALTYGGESPVIAAIMALAVGAAVVVSGKVGEDLRRESFMKSLDFEGDPESERVVQAVFGLHDASRVLNRKVMYAFMGASSLAGVAISTFRAVEENVGIGLSFGLRAVLVSAGSFAASWYYYDPAKTYISLTQGAVDEAEDIWLNTDIDAIEEHNACIEEARHIVSEYRQRAEAAWNMTLAGAAAAMAANSDVIGIAQAEGHWILRQQMPVLRWPDLSQYLQIIDRDDVAPDSELFPIFSEDGTNQIVRPELSLFDDHVN